MIQAPFLPTPKKTTEKMFDVAKVKPGEVVYDLGCGDGRFVRIASRKYQARAIGIELNPLVYAYAKLLSLGKKNETILFQDFIKRDLSDADVIMCYLLPPTMRKLEIKLEQEAKKGTRIISHGFQFKNWKPIETILPDKKEYGKIYVFEKQ